MGHVKWLRTAVLPMINAHPRVPAKSKVVASFLANSSHNNQYGLLELEFEAGSQIIIPVKPFRLTTFGLGSPMKWKEHDGLH